MLKVEARNAHFLKGGEFASIKKELSEFEIGLKSEAFVLCSFERFQSGSVKLLQHIVVCLVAVGNEIQHRVDRLFTFVRSDTIRIHVFQKALVAFHHIVKLLELEVKLHYLLQSFETPGTKNDFERGCSPQSRFGLRRNHLLETLEGFGRVVLTIAFSFVVCVGEVNSRPPVEDTHRDSQAELPPPRLLLR